MSKPTLEDHERAKGYVGTVGSRHYYYLDGFWYVFNGVDLEQKHEQKIPEDIRRKAFEKEHNYERRYGII